MTVETVRSGHDMRSVGSVGRPRAARPREISGCTPTSVAANRMSQGTAASKTDSGATSRNNAPTRAPAALVAATARTAAPCPASSRRKPKLPVMPPGTSPTVFVTLAATGLMPIESSIGKLTREPAPTALTTNPAPTPAPRAVHRVLASTRTAWRILPPGPRLRPGRVRRAGTCGPRAGHRGLGRGTG